MMASKRTNNGLGELAVQDSHKRGKIEITVSPEDGKPGDWICPNDSCKHHNYKFRQVCQKCFTNKYGEHVEKVEGKKQGDWNCPVDGNLNYAWRTHCKKCGAPNPKVPGIAQRQYKNANDWTCPNCGDHVFASRSNCRKCGFAKSARSNWQGMGQFGGQGRQYGAPAMQKGLKSGDWTCPTCFDLVFESRSNCRKCNTPRSAGFSQGYSGQSATRSTGRPGDWTCPKCGDHVYASRSSCRKCDTPKPEHAMLAPESLPELFGGDWRCPKCFDHVYASRQSCRKCNTPKPHEG